LKSGGLTRAAQRALRESVDGSRRSRLMREPVALGRKLGPDRFSEQQTW
jgi:hypothetical protein